MCLYLLKTKYLSIEGDRTVGERGQKVLIGLVGKRLHKVQNH